MRKDDIIKQKLFETCKLSEFYLNLIVNNRLTDPDSPFELALAFKQKLNEIVERYDRLLDAAAQREQLTLQLQHAHKPPLAPPTRANTTSICRSAAATPSNQRTYYNTATTTNKSSYLLLGSGGTHGGLISPLNVSTSSSVMNGLNLNCISQPTTPLQHPSCFPHHLVNNHLHHHSPGTALNSTTVSRSSSATNFSLKTYNKSKSSFAPANSNSTPSRYRTSPSTPSGLGTSETLTAAQKLEQRIAAVYYDDWDEDEFEQQRNHRHQYSAKTNETINKSSPPLGRVCVFLFFVFS